MTAVENNNAQECAERRAACQLQAESPTADELRLARTNLLEALTVKFNNLFTTIVANCEMALLHLDETHPAVAHLASAKRAAYQASDANGRVIALVRECREAHK